VILVESLAAIAFGMSLVPHPEIRAGLDDLTENVRHASGHETVFLELLSYNLGVLSGDVRT